MWLSGPKWHFGVALKGKTPTPVRAFESPAHRGNSAPTPQELPNDDWLLRSRAGPLIRFVANTMNW